MVVGAGACWLLPGVDDVAMFAWYVGGVAVVPRMVVAGARAAAASCGGWPFFL